MTASTHGRLRTLRDRAYPVDRYNHMKPFAIFIIMCAAASSAGGSHAATAEPTIAAFGSWRSPITTQMLVEGAIRFGDVAVDVDTVYWVEGRAQEAGRY